MMRYIREVEGGMNFLKGARRRIMPCDASPPPPPFPTAADISLGRRRFARLGFWNHKMAVYSSACNADMCGLQVPALAYASAVSCRFHKSATTYFSFNNLVLRPQSYLVRSLHKVHSMNT